MGYTVGNMSDRSASATTTPNGRFVVPEKVVTHFHLRVGDTVVDLGAGSGYFVPAIARAVGAEGHVYACEIQRELVEKIGTLARTQGLNQVHPVWCDVEAPEGSTVASGTADVVIMVNFLFQVDDISAVLQEAARVLRAGGKLFVIDWSESFGGLGPHPDHVVDAAAVEAAAESIGMVFERSFNAGDHHYGLAFRTV